MDSNTDINPNKIASYIRKLVGFLKIVFVIICAFLVLFIVIHNFFAPKERDIPTETITNLLRLLPVKDGKGLEWNQNGTHG